MQSFYRGVVGELIERWRALPLHPWLAQSNYIGYSPAHDALLRCLVPPVKSPFASPVAPAPPTAFNRCIHPVSSGRWWVAVCRLYARGEAHGKPHSPPPFTYSMLLATNDRIIHSAETVAIAAQQRHGKFPGKTNKRVFFSQIDGRICSFHPTSPSSNHPVPRPVLSGQLFIPVAKPVSHNRSYPTYHE
ncbi:uncharacterized protein K441DRAFT_298526 [Cenococcum geophilum 1.58]|uniref:uncharacterized protein n=1 Tax=Cenococcum geophilum 1.58 TaxID=794803 RepID=UPI0035900338|nr:hypothetical protein K441DRAFT_298526 [Cenococcum geophilum 1.58]